MIRRPTIPTIPTSAPRSSSDAAVTDPPAPRWATLVASEPHVPGPGRNRPAPKNVATSVAHRGAGGSVTAASLLLLGALVGIVGIVGLRIIQRAGDDISATRPLAQVNNTAAHAAERKVGIRGQHDLPAGWTTQAANAFLRHSSVISSQLSAEVSAHPAFDAQSVPMDWSSTSLIQASAEN